MIDYLISVGDALSQLVGRVIGYTETPNESISGAAYRKDGTLRKIIDTIFYPLEQEHTLMSHQADIARAIDLLVENGFYVGRDPIQHEEYLFGDQPEMPESHYDVPKSIGMAVSKTEDSTLASIAPVYEEDWVLFNEVLEDKDRRADWIERVRNANWPEIVSTYETPLLDDIRINGTVFAFSSDIASTILDAVRHELSERSSGFVPKGHGMGEDGRQK